MRSRDAKLHHLNAGLLSVSKSWVRVLCCEMFGKAGSLHTTYLLEVSKYLSNGCEGSGQCAWLLSGVGIKDD